MRISDWSSDVCSSDLQVVLVGAEPVEDVDPVRRRDLKPSDDVGERAVEARSVREIVVIAVAHALAQESFDLAAVEAVDRTAEPVGDPLAALDAVVKSEEHTSELQSLMRISYAVFCLKNKNKYKRQKQQEDKKT